MKNITKLILISLIGINLLNGATAEVVGGFMPLNASWNMHLGILIDKNTDTAHIQISGPSTKWFSVGFNGTQMKNTYAIIIDGNGNYVERKLERKSKGTLLADSLTEMSNTVNNGVRTIYLTRPQVGLTASHYSFSDNQDTVNLIFARGNGSSLSQHTSANMDNSKSISKEIPDMPEIGIAPHGLAEIELQLTNLVYGIVNSLESSSNLQSNNWTTAQIIEMAPPEAGPIGWLFSTNVTSTTTSGTRYFRITN